MLVIVNDSGLQTVEVPQNQFIACFCGHSCYATVWGTVRNFSSCVMGAMMGFFDALSRSECSRARAQFHAQSMWTLGFRVLATTHNNTQQQQHTATHSNTQQHTATHSNTQQHTTTHDNTRQHTTTHDNTRQHTTSHDITRHHTTSHDITRQHTTTHDNTRQHTTTHDNTRQKQQQQ